jgi:bifunctional non-homologous end joining protein LigD
MEECRWLRPELVAQFEFVEWTPDPHLRHSHYGRIKARDVRRDELDRE